MSQKQQNFITEKSKSYLQLRRLIDGFRYKKNSNLLDSFAEPEGESFDIENGYKTQYLSSHSPESKILESWYEYLGAVLVEEQARILPDVVFDTEAERRDYLETIEFFTRHKPSGEDLRDLLNLPDDFDDVISRINDDIKKLL